MKAIGKLDLGRPQMPDTSEKSLKSVTSISARVKAAKAYVF